MNVKNLKGLYKSTRVEISVVFIIPIIAIAISCALSTGNPMSWLNLIPGAGVLTCLILISNSLNNLIDKDIDIAAHKSHNAKSEKYHPLVSHDLNTHGVMQLFIFTCIFLIIFTISLTATAGKLAGVLILIGLFFAVEYNLPPFKLAYRPFSELTMLLPSTIIAVAGIQYILVQEITMQALFVSASFGMFSACWFIAQSAIDYDSDKKNNKVTTPVYFGIDPLLRVVTVYCIAAVLIPLIGVFIGRSWGILPLSVVCAIYLFFYWLIETDEMKLWKRSMLVSFIYGISASVIILLGVI